LCYSTALLDIKLFKTVSHIFQELFKPVSTLATCSNLQEERFSRLLVTNSSKLPLNRFPYDHYDRYNHCDRWKKRSAIILIMWKSLFSDHGDYSNHMETSLYGN